jgi:putative DNA primase/helicase
MAHEMLTQAQLKVFGNVGLVMIDESPLDAFMFGIDRNDQMLLPLDLLHEPNDDPLLTEGREALYRALHRLRVPIDRHLGVPPSRQNLRAFIDQRVGGGVDLAEHDAEELHKREWRNKVVPEIRPDMTKKQIEKKLEEAAGNGIVKRCATLFELIAQLNEATEVERSGRIQVQRGKDGREVRLVGLRAVAKGWRSVRTLICDATGEAELLRAIWPDLVCEEDSMTKWQQLPRLQNTRIFQMVDRSLSKYVVAVEGNEKEVERKAKAARRMYAALLMTALQYDGAPVGVIVYKSTEDWIRQNCFIPSWLTLTHHGDITGTNVFEIVRALFVLGRLLPPAEAITRQAEALFGHHIDKRSYRKTRGRIPIVPDAAGNNFIEVTTWKHPIANAEMPRQQVTEGGLIQAVGRARAGLRKAGEPLDVHLWTDVPLPVLGPVEPMLWDEVETNLDGLMLATGGVWLESIPDAVKAYEGLFTRDGLKQARKGQSGCFPYRVLIRETPSLRQVTYQRIGERRRPARACFLADIADPRAWLEDRLGPLARFEVESHPSTPRIEDQRARVPAKREGTDYA